MTGVGDWDQYRKLKTRGKRLILTEWRWNQGTSRLRETGDLTFSQGLSKQEAQKQFIVEAVKLGITPPEWEEPFHLIDNKLWEWPIDDDATPTLPETEDYILSTPSNSGWWDTVSGLLGGTRSLPVALSSPPEEDKLQLLPVQQDKLLEAPRLETRGITDIVRPKQNKSRYRRLQQRSDTPTTAEYREEEEMEFIQRHHSKCWQDLVWMGISLLSAAAAGRVAGTISVSPAKSGGVDHGVTRLHSRAWYPTEI